MNIKEVLVKANINNNFSNFVILKIKLDFSNRSEPTLGLFKIDGHFYNSHVWTKNGIPESYFQAIKEAVNNGLNEDNKELTNYIMGI